MPCYFLAFAVGLAVFGSSVAVQAADCPPVGSLPNYLASPDLKLRAYESAEFSVKKGDDSEAVQVAGKTCFQTYSIKEGAEVMSEAYSQETYIEVTAIEEKAFQSSIKPPEANAMKAALDKEGRVALYVNFDFNKATLKPDAAPVIAQVVKLMKDNRSLKLEVGGYTDNVGARDYNVRLSGSRAAAVVAAVVAQGIAAGRLSAAGYGPDKPVADNGTDEGRAKNRRVELVKP